MKTPKRGIATMQIIKRDGRIKPYEISKIKHSIFKACKFSNSKIKNKKMKILLNEIDECIKDKKRISTDELQNIINNILLEHNYIDISEKYILCRKTRDLARNNNSDINNSIKRIISNTNRENANVGNSPAAKLLQVAEITGSKYGYDNLLNKTLKNAINDNIIYIHDFSWQMIGTTTCNFIPLRKLLQNGFNGGHGFVRSPKRIKSASALSCIIIQSSQNDQHGGQAYGWYDRDMAPYVKLEYEWQLAKIKSQFIAAGVQIEDEKIEELARQNTEEETFQAMESVIFNLCTMHSRGGAQVPFSSLNIGTDTSKEGRLITKCLLNAYKNGLGKNEQPVFPIIIFKLKKGINFEKEDPNYDLFKLSMEVSSNRMFPNYVFQDSSFNKDFPSDIPAMGCRTRVSWNINKPESEQTCEGRGNLSFSSINIVNLALRAVNTKQNYFAHYDLLSKDFNLHDTSNYTIRAFFCLLDKYMDLITNQLYERYKYQCSFKKMDFPFLLSGLWIGSDKLSVNDNLNDILKHGTLSVGFIGLAETLKCLTGYHHAENENADKLGESIIKFMREKLDKKSKEMSLNFTLLATPAEGLSGKFVKKDRKLFGLMKGVTDKDWYTNSFHCPVEYDVTVSKKISIEGKYHKYCNAGHISYIELDSEVKNNLDAYESILRYMQKNDMGYVAINFPIDRCRKCNYTGIIKNSCPKCGENDISRIRRITGYLAELEMFNEAKIKETEHRKKHIYANI